MKLKLNIQRFASTNKTANYNLSQYIGSDKPTYLGDYNSDMNKIDTQMKANSDGVTSASTKADLAKTTADTALNNADLAQTTAEEAQTTGTNALQKATDVEAELSKINLTLFEDVSEVTVSKGTLKSQSLKIAKNSDGSLAKIYGNITVVTTETGQYDFSFQTSLRPTEEIKIKNVGFARNVVNIVSGQSFNYDPLGDITITIGTNGLITFRRTVYLSQQSSMVISLIPVLLFIKNFGDTN